MYSASGYGSTAYSQPSIGLIEGYSIVAPGNYNYSGISSTNLGINTVSAGNYDYSGIDTTNLGINTVGVGGYNYSGIDPTNLGVLEAGQYAYVFTGQEGLAIERPLKDIIIIVRDPNIIGVS